MPLDHQDIEARAWSMNIIETLWPPDQTEEGATDLWQAICDEWQHLPTPILIRLANIQLTRENR